MVIRPDGQNPRLSRPEHKAITIMVRLTVGRKKNGQQLDKSHCPFRGGMRLPRILKLLVMPRYQQLGRLPECRKLLRLFGQLDYMGF